MLTPDFSTAFGMTALAGFVAAWVLWLLGRAFWTHGVPQAMAAAALFGLSYVAFAVQTQWANQELFVVSKAVVSAGISAFTLAVLRFRQRNERWAEVAVVGVPLVGTGVLAVACLPQSPGWFNQLQSGITLLQMAYLLRHLFAMRGNTPGNGWVLVTAALSLQTLGIVLLLAAGRSEAPEFELSSSTPAVVAMWITCLVLFLNMMVICIGFLVMLRDRQAAVEQHRAGLDPLTELSNRSVLIERLSNEIQAAQQAPRPVAVILIDIDHFKSFNDNHGHLVGDLAIQTVARVLAAHSRASDVVARYGGEEFVLVLPDTPGEVALALANRLRQAIADTPLILRSGERLQLTASIGVHAEVPARSARWQTLVEAADSAMYAAKRGGRNQVRGTSALPVGD